MSAQKQADLISEAEYWAGEEVSPTKHEYLGGRVYSMEVGSYNHTTICGNVCATAKSTLSGHTCRARSSMQRVKVEATGLNTYPDAVIFCPPARFEGSNDHTLLTPKVIFEVMSDSTERFDRGDKFRAYAEIETMTDYVLIDQNRITVEHFHRTPDGWLLNSYLKRRDALPLADLEIELSLDAIYDELDLPEAIPTVLNAPREAT